MLDSVMLQASAGAVASSDRWEAECRLGFEPGARGGMGEARRAPEVALLTGASGFLGGFLLRELLERTNLRIVCLLRGRDEAAAAAKLETQLGGTPAAGRVEVVRGDLARPDLGLGTEGFEALARRVDVIYHNAAQIHLGHRYDRLKGPNVEGTRTVLRLAFAGGRWKPIHYVSSIGVVTSRPYLDRSEARETDVPADLDTLNGGYPQSKAVAESLVRRAAALGLPATIYRPGLLTGCSTTGRWTADDLLANLMRTWIHTGVAYDPGGRLDLTPVDYVARSIVHIAARPEAVGRTFHLVNPSPPSAPELVAIFTRAGFPVRMLDFEAWRDAVERQADARADSRLAAALLLFPPSGGEAAVRFPLVYRIRFDDAAARSLLDAPGIHCPAIDADVIGRYVGYLAANQQL